MNDLIDITIGELVVFLETNLPKLSGNWWQLLVLPQLSHEQARLGARNLSQLDFACLLRILERNWIALSNRLQLTLREGQNWIKELQTIRNNWAHRTASSLIPKDFYRDIDTIERVLNLLGAQTESMRKISDVKETVLQKMVHRSGKEMPSDLNLDTNSAAGLAKITDNKFPQADSIRQFTLQQFVLPARRKNASEFTIRAGDVHKMMGLVSRMPAVCNAIGGKKFTEMSNVKLNQRTGPKNGANVYFTFSLNDDV